ncbi:probable cytochrome P450 310a1 [Drosophila grimshawi]|uniref:GH10525 n=1 Tax=Drosophila grimshawi TaxID=7222 RepID=B4JDN0_DROGR|nr:probable cytochrome P450 310a1 [Drosophila grimshawi]EDW03400.1 GH10525 [Drosophila grimshawi]
MWLLLPILAYTVIFVFVRHIYSYWRRKGFPSESPSLSLHFLAQVYRREFRHVDAISDAYQMGRDRLFGIYCFFRPVLLVRNLELARSILEQSYGHFSECKWDYVKGYRRINLLERLTPIFNSSRLSAMFNNAQHVANHMMQHLLDKAEQGQVQLDMQQLLRVFAVNIIGNLIYGLDVNNFEQSDHILNNFVKRPVQCCGLQSFTLRNVPQKSSLAYRLLDIIKRNVALREMGGIIRKDILQLLVLFRNGNDLSGDKWSAENAYEDDKLLSIQRLAKVAEDLLHSALDSIASTLTLTLYEIVQQPLIVEKLQVEIKELDLVHGQLQFEQLEELRYMDMCLRETLRKYPPLPIIERICRKTFKLPNTKFSIEEGKTLMVPLLAIQRDEKYFGEPLKYKPLRFLHDKSEKTSEQRRTALVGFGLGSAQCVAQNFAKMVIKLALVKLLHNYHLELDADSNVEVSHLPAPFITSKDGLKMQLKAREIVTQSNYRKNSF